MAKNNKNNIENELTLEWQRYEKVRDYLAAHQIYSNVDKAHRFYEGDQWGQEAPKDTPLPVMNIIKPIVKYKVSVVAQHNWQLNFSYLGNDTAFDDLANTICVKIGDKITAAWEANNMDTKLWEILSECAIGGSAGVYTYFDSDKNELIVELKDNTEILFGDEQEEDIQKQPYIILPYRRPIAEIREEARKNGLSETDIDKIVADNETANQSGDFAKTEVNNDDEYSKALCLLYMYKKDGTVHITKSTRTIRFMPDTDTKYTRYPVAFLVWEPIKGSARGKGEVLDIIPNQIEINKNYGRRAISIKMTSYPKLVYLSDQIDNPEELMNVGAAIGIQGSSAQNVNDVISYLKPITQSYDARAFCTEMITITKELAGAGDVALGNINPENTSGKSILAVRDASATPLNLQIARTKAFIEDIGRNWWDIIAMKFGDEILDNEKEMFVPAEGQKLSEKEKENLAQLINMAIMNKAKVKLRVDATPTDPYSRAAETQTLENYMLNNKITIEEFLQALPDNSVVPKDKLLRIYNSKARQLLMQQAEQIMQLEGKIKNFEDEKQQAIIRGTAEMRRITALINQLKGNSPQNKADENNAAAG